ncbi:MAG: M23 family metallopeptidase [Rhodospirillales bacterium]|nr:M23 family metallopeptidase [Rhodospirillales bacterium]
MRRLLSVGATFVVLASSACAYMEFSPTPAASRKTLASAVVTPNPPRPYRTGAQATDDAVTQAPLDDFDAEQGKAGDAGAMAARIHTVQSGETLYGISRAYGVGVYDLAQYNGLAAPYAIHEGQRLSIPRDGSPPARSAGASDTQETGAGRPPYPSDVEEAPLVASLPAAAEPLPTAPRRSGAGFIWPAEGKILSDFGPKARGLRNDGINIAVRRGAPVRAIDNGVVAYAGNELRGFGNMVLIKHAGGWISTYAHNERLLVARGDRVSRGQMIARAGDTGRADTPQLHFELRKGLTPVDPLAYLPPQR